MTRFTESEICDTIRSLGEPTTAEILKALDPTMHGTPNRSCTLMYRAIQSLGRRLRKMEQYGFVASRTYEYRWVRWSVVE